MAGFASSNQEEPITTINVTPLVDIVLVLLIIFMVTAKLVVSRGIPLDLPQAATGAEVQSVFTVSIEKDGSLHVDGAPLDGDRKALRDRAAQAKQESPGMRAVLRADGDVPHRKVMAILDTLRQANIDNVAFAVTQDLSAEPHERLSTGEESSP